MNAFWVGFFRPFHDVMRPICWLTKHRWSRPKKAKITHYGRWGKVESQREGFAKKCGRCWSIREVKRRKPRPSSAGTSQ